MAAVMEGNAPAHPAAQNVFSIAVTVDEAIRRQVLEGEGLVVVAEACTVDCYDMAVVAHANLNAVIAFQKELAARRDRLIAPALQIVNEAKAQFNPGINGAARAEEIYRKKLADYQAEERRKAAETKRLQDEEARRSREEAQRLAAAAQARAEAAAQEARRQAAEAAERERVALAAGNARAAAAAAAERAKKEEEERQRREAGQREADRLQMEAAARVFNMPQTPEPTPAVGGSSVTWSAALGDDCKGADDEEKATDSLLKICNAIAAGRKELVSLIKHHWPAANRMAGAQKKVFNVPGLKAVPSSHFVNRKGKK